MSDRTEAEILAGILARGYDVHTERHGPDGDHSVRSEDGSRYQTAADQDAGVSFVMRGGMRYSVTVRECPEAELAPEDGRRYFVSRGDGPERAVSKADFCRAERAAGFHLGHGPDDITKCATGGFSGASVSGRIEFVR